MAKDERGPSVKIVLVGDAKVGKTALVARWARDEFDESYRPTAAIQILTREVAVEDGGPLRLQVYDMGLGQSEAPGGLASYVASADVALLLYDTSDPRSIDSLAYWHEEVSSIVGESCIFIIVGCKTDLRPALGVMRKAHSFCDLIGAESYLDTSANHGSNVIELFETRIATALRRHTHIAGGSDRESSAMVAIVHELQQKNAELEQRLDTDGAQFMEALYSLEAENQELKALVDGQANGEGQPHQEKENGVVTENAELKQQLENMLGEIDAFEKEKEGELEAAREECHRKDVLLQEKDASIDQGHKEREDMVMIMAHEQDELMARIGYLQQDNIDLREKLIQREAYHGRRHSHAVASANSLGAKSQSLARSSSKIAAEDGPDPPLTFMEHLVCCATRR